MKKITDLTDAEITQIITDLFSPKEIKGLRRNKKKGTVSCSITTEWGEGSDVAEIEDILTLRNPFDYGLYEAIDFEDGSFPTDGEDVFKFKQFCFAMGVQPEYLTKSNPYLKKNSKKTVKRLWRYEWSRFEAKFEKEEIYDTWAFSSRELNILYPSINNKLYMISDDEHHEKDFFIEVSEALDRDYLAVIRAGERCHRDFLDFQNFWKEFSENRSEG